MPSAQGDSSNCEGITLFAGFSSALLEALEEGQELLWWAITAIAPIEWLCRCQWPLLEFEVGVKINLGCLH